MFISDMECVKTKAFLNTEMKLYKVFFLKKQYLSGAESN